MGKEDLSKTYTELESEMSDLVCELSRHGDGEGNPERTENVLDSVEDRLEELRYLIRN